jgi:acyl carrier protein
MTKKEIFNILSDILKNYTDIQATMDTEIVTLGLDSLDSLEFVVDVDSRFNLQITDDELQEMFFKSKKVKQLVEKIEKHMKK